MRAASAFALVLSLTLLARASTSAAAPKKTQQQQCIAAAESGQQLRSAERLIEARKAFGLCTASACPAVIRRDCGRWVDELDAVIPTISVKLEDERGAEVADGRVLMNGEAFQRAADGQATAIDPGQHRFRWEPDANSHVEEQVVVRQGERNKVILLRQRPTTTGPTRAAAPTEPRAASPLPWIVGGAGAALVATGGIFWGIGLNDRSTLSATCASSHTCAQSDVDASHTKLVIGDVLLGVGVVAVVGAVYLLLRQGSEPPAVKTSSR